MPYQYSKDCWKELWPWASEHKDLVFFILSPTGVWCLIQTTQLFQLIWRGSCQVFIIAIRGTFAWRHPTRMERMAIQQPRHQPLDFDLRVIVRRWKFWSGTRARKATSKFKRNHLWSFKECVVVFLAPTRIFFIKFPMCVHEIPHLKMSGSDHPFLGVNGLEGFLVIETDVQYMNTYNWILEIIPGQWRKYMKYSWWLTSNSIEKRFMGLFVPMILESMSYWLMVCRNPKKQPPKACIKP